MQQNRSVTRNPGFKCSATAFMGPFAIRIQWFQVKRKLAHVFWLETTGFQLKSNETLQIQMIEEKI